MTEAVRLTANDDEISTFLGRDYKMVMGSFMLNYVGVLSIKMPGY